MNCLWNGVDDVDDDVTVMEIANMSESALGFEKALAVDADFS